MARLSVFPIPKYALNIDKQYWYSEYAKIATGLGLVESNNNVFNHTKEITVGDAARSIVLTANKLNINGYSNLTGMCDLTDPNKYFVDLLKSKGYLSGINADQHKIFKIEFGLLCKLINDILNK